MTDSRPRPQYGEYASPEEQAKAIGIPFQKSHARPKPTEQQVLTEHPAPTAPAPVSEEHGGAADVAEQDSKEKTRGPRDTVLTVVLLGLGLAWVLLSIPGTSDLAGTLDRTYALQGYTGHYGPVALASTLGLIINISSIVLWGVTCAVSIAVLRRHRRAFYIPVIGAAISGIVVIALTLVAMLNDPGLLAYLGTLQK